MKIDYGSGRANRLLAGEGECSQVDWDIRLVESEI